MTSIAYFEHNWMPLEQVHIPVSCRGFLFAESVYESIALRHGKLQAPDAHIDRLMQNMKLLNFHCHWSRSDWLHHLGLLCHKNQLPDQNLYLHVSSGHQWPRNHSIEENLPASILMCSYQPSGYIYPNSLHVQLQLDPRWQQRFIKTTNLLPHTQALRKAKQADYDEVLWHQDNWLTESVSSNVLLYHAETGWMTPNQDLNVVPGTTLQLVAEILQQRGEKLHHRPIHCDELHDMQELWLVASYKGLLPVDRVDSLTIGKKAPNQWLGHQLHALLKTYRLIDPNELLQ